MSKSKNNTNSKLRSDLELQDLEDLSEPEDISEMPVQMNDRRNKRKGKKASRKNNGELSPDEDGGRGPGRKFSKRSRGDQGDQDDGAISSEYSHLSVPERTVTMKREELIEKYQDP